MEAVSERNKQSVQSTITGILVFIPADLEYFGLLKHQMYASFKIWITRSVACYWPVAM
jgi:hypothetical protein